MPVRHYIAKNEPIVFTVYYDTVKYEEVIQAFDLIDRVLAESNYPMVYWIGDSTAVDATVAIIKQAVEETINGRNGSGGDSRVIPIAVMKADLYKYMSDEFENHDNSLQLPFFESAPEAYDFVQFLMGMQQ